MEPTNTEGEIKVNSPQEIDTRNPRQIERSDQLFSDFNQLTEKVGAREEERTKAQIKHMQEREKAQPFNVFATIAGETTRADNIYCGINGEARHKALAEYLQQEADLTQGDMHDVLKWLAKRELKLASDRRLVKNQLILDQLTDATNYQEGRLIDENTPFFNSSLDFQGQVDISDRVLPENVKEKWLQELKESKQEIQGWEEERQKAASIGEAVTQFIIPNNIQSSNEAITRGSIHEDTQHWLRAIQSTADWINPTVELLETDKINSNELHQTLLKYMGNLTAAEAVLEHQQYFVGVGLIRAAANGKLPTETKKLISD